MDLLIGAAVRLFLIVSAVKVYLWARKQKAKARWQRRIATFLFLLPLLVWLAELVLPDGMQTVVRGVALFNGWIDAGLEWAVSQAKQELSGVWALVAKPVIHALFYTGLGLLIGWPIDRWKAKQAEQEGQGEGQAE